MKNVDREQAAVSGLQAGLGSCLQSERVLVAHGAKRWPTEQRGGPRPQAAAVGVDGVAELNFGRVS